MASQMEWSHDFCLFCDRQIPGGAYCSQACRVGDLEKSAGGAPAPISPAARSSMSSASSSWSAAHGGHSGSGLSLPPPINFAAYRSSSRTESTPSSPQYYASQQHHYFQQSGTQQTTRSGNSSTKHGLTPSSSRASLSSLTAGVPTSHLSDQAVSQLRGYSDAFDQVREMKRRMTYA